MRNNPNEATFDEFGLLIASNEKMMMMMMRMSIRQLMLMMIMMRMAQRNCEN